MLKYLKTLPYYDVVQYIRSTEESVCIPFTGTPKKHPYDKEKFILISDPLSQNATFYEFNLEDIEHVENIGSIATEEGDNVKMVKIYVKKGSFGIRYEPFTVDEPIHYFHDSESNEA